MKIIVVSNFFYPENTPRAFRTTEIAKELSRLGHKVVLYIPHITDKTLEFCHSHQVECHPLSIPRWNGFNLTGGKLVILFKRIANRLLNTFLIYPSIVYLRTIPKALAHQKDFDLLISIAAPHTIHWGVNRAVRKNKQLTKCWIADCGDPFMLCKIDTFRKPFYFKYFEKSFCRKADVITIPVENGKDGYYPEFRSKIRVVPQGFDFSAIKTVEVFRPNPIVTFVYAGTFIPGVRDPRPVLEFLVHSGKDFRFYIYTNQPGLVKDYQPLLKDKLIVSGYIDREELIYRMSASDFLLNLENGTKIQTPSKLIDYSLSKRPVLSIYSQHIDEQKFNQFLNRNYEQQMELPDVTKYDIRHVVGSFLNLKEECTRR